MTPNDFFAVTEKWLDQLHAYDYYAKNKVKKVDDVWSSLDTITKHVPDPIHEMIAHDVKLALATDLISKTSAVGTTCEAILQGTYGFYKRGYFTKKQLFFVERAMLYALTGETAKFPPGFQQWTSGEKAAPGSTFLFGVSKKGKLRVKKDSLEKLEVVPIGYDLAGGIKGEALVTFSADLGHYYPKKVPGGAQEQAAGGEDQGVVEHAGLETYEEAASKASASIEKFLAAFLEEVPHVKLTLDSYVPFTGTGKPVGKLPPGSQPWKKKGKGKG